MRIMCYSDLHGSFPELHDNEDLYDMIILAGDVLYDDIHYYNWLPESIMRQKVSDLAQAWRQVKKPIYAIRGNHDYNDSAGTFINFCRINNDIRLVIDTTKQDREVICIAGIEWFGEAYWDLPGDRDLEPLCEEVCTRFKKLNVPPNTKTILVTHYPPQFTRLLISPFSNAGHYCYTKLIQTLQPIAVVCGHIHEMAGTKEDFWYEGGKTTVYSTGPEGMILEI